MEADTELIKSYSQIRGASDFFLDLGTSIALKDGSFAESMADKILALKTRPLNEGMSISRGQALLLCALYSGGTRAVLEDVAKWQKSAIWRVARSAWPDSNNVRSEIGLITGFGLPASLKKVADSLGYSTTKFGWRRKIDHELLPSTKVRTSWWMFW